MNSILVVTVILFSGVSGLNLAHADPNQPKGHWAPLHSRRRMSCPDMDLRKAEKSYLTPDLNGKPLTATAVNVLSEHEFQVDVDAVPGKNVLSFQYGSGDGNSPYCEGKEEFYAGTNALSAEVRDEKNALVTGHVEIALELGGSNGFREDRKIEGGKVVFENLYTDHNLGWWVTATTKTLHGSIMVQKPESGKAYVVTVKGTAPLLKGCETLNDGKAGLNPDCWQKSK